MAGMFDPGGGSFGDPSFVTGMGGPAGGSSFGSRGPFGFGSTGYNEAQNSWLAQVTQNRNIKSNENLFAMGQAGENQRAQIAANAATTGAYLRNAQFGQLFPFLTGQLGKAQEEYKVGGQSPPSPEISVHPVYNPQQIQQQVNAVQAGNTATAANQTRQDESSLAGRGFGSNSPLLRLLTQGRQMGAQQLNSQAAQQIPFNAAQSNRQQVLASQQAREGQFASRQQEDIARRQQLVTTQNALTAALAGLI